MMADANNWMATRIKPDQINKYLVGGKCFIDAPQIENCLKTNTKNDAARVRAILEKSLAIQTLAPDEAACLLNVADDALWEEMEAVAGKVKQKVYDNRIVTFAPLYCSNLCVNDCQYCGFRRSNSAAQRHKLTSDQIRKETEVLAGVIGHKRLIVVFGEHPQTDTDYIASTIETIMSAKVQARRGFGQIRRCNVNAAPISIEDLQILKKTGIGTFQVFQETYHPEQYRLVHPAGTIKGDYLWRLYAMHRSMEAGVDDVGLGALFGLYDWKFEVMGLLHHALELESKFGIGPHTISFPRIEPADNTPLSNSSKYKVSDANFRKLVTVIRLAVPYTGMILTARENAAMRKQILPLGCTQIDASSRIGVGAYADALDEQQGNKQQFYLSDTRSLDTAVRELATAGFITSFCTAGYRCGRTGKQIMNLLRCGKEGHFCKLNAVITFREWLDDFASPITIAAGEIIIAREIEEIRQKLPDFYMQFLEYYEETKAGKRDLYF
ncbi:MAG: [FeFe] hydrogenase H-cluster radical SAM maturase HydG [Verrucomicrobia bacterium]|nr:[FeFe] hydrogenase H-cluster radical SAM maturase HydG [Verrucomicrobiota bacterium]MBU1855598.1 [FeFe] hydrogenase H-cluster radical SAM maturase HydG [Verrucomicrobiota bacterium]